MSLAAARRFRQRARMLTPVQIMIIRGGALVILAACAVHGFLGIAGEALVGATVSAETAANASLDSQNRFYGITTAFLAYVLWQATRDPGRYMKLLKAALVTLAVAGLFRVLSVAIVGWPSAIIVALGAVELVVPSLMLLWLWASGGTKETTAAPAAPPLPQDPPAASP